MTVRLSDAQRCMLLRMVSHHLGGRYRSGFEDPRYDRPLWHSLVERGLVLRLEADGMGGHYYEITEAGREVVKHNPIGRPRLHPSSAEKQKAYRDRKRASKAFYNCKTSEEGV